MILVEINMLLNRATICLSILLLMGLVNCGPKPTADAPDAHLENRTRELRRYIIDRILDNSADSVYLSDRRELKILSMISCDLSQVIIADTVDGITYEVSIKTGSFDPDMHSFVFRDNDSTRIVKIDEQVPFGAYYGMPSTEISSLQIQINGTQVSSPDTVFSNLYEPNMCRYLGFEKPISAYLSADRQLLYIYIFGGNAADMYLAKLTFDRNRFAHKIVVDYIPLSLHGSFRSDFIGF